MNAKITERVQEAKSLTEARVILKDYRLKLSDAIQAQIQKGGSSRFIKALRDEQTEVNNALIELPVEGGAQ